MPVAKGAYNPFWRGERGYRIPDGCVCEHDWSYTKRIPDACAAFVPDKLLPGEYDYDGERHCTTCSHHRECHA